MSKTAVTFVCTECGGEALRWAGQCPHCRAWNTLQEFTVRRRGASGRPQARPAGVQAPRALPITEVPEDETPRRALRWGELNRVLGGGVVAGSLVLVGGEPGVGKSTLLMHAAQQVAEAGGTVLYASAEESVQQVRMRARRLGALQPGFLVLAEIDLDAICAAIEAGRPQLAVVDSIQTVSDPGLEAAAGSVTQVRDGAARLMRLAKESGTPIFLVGHVTKEGAIAGPRVLEHIVDTVLYLEGERRQEFRILRATKNRFGSTDEIGIFAMGEAGLEEVPDPSSALLGGAAAGAPGTAVIATLEGTRPLLVEVQSLVTGKDQPMPRRVANGFDLSRLHMILAVAEQRAGLRLSGSEVYVNVAGGIRVVEPAADLGLALSLASNLKERPLPPDLLVVGELGLTGEVRRVGQLEKRLQEAARHGFRRALVPAGSSPARTSGLQLDPVRDLEAAIAAAISAPIVSGTLRELKER